MKILRKIDEDVIRLREVENLKFREIGEKLGITGAHASIKYRSAKYRQRRLAQAGGVNHELSTRSTNVLTNIGFESLDKEKIKKWLDQPEGYHNFTGFTKLVRYRNCGKKSTKEILDWLGIKHPYFEHLKLE